MQIVAENSVEPTPVSSVRSFLDWLGGEAFPWWAEHGQASAHGVFVECLKANGQPELSVRRRVRVQARQTYSFAVAAWRGWADTAALAIAGGEHLVSVCADQDTPGRYFHAVDVAGSLQDRRCDLYEQACVILAYSALFELTGEARWSAAAFEAVSYVREGLAHPAGGYCEGDSATGPRRQNPHMHMLEAYLALFEATGNPLAREGAADMVALFDRAFFEPSAGVLLEDFEDDLTPADGARVEPGHEMEWVCLLENWSRIACEPVLPAVYQLFNHARTIGVNPRSGLLYDAVSTDGEILKDTSRLWPQTERIKAEFAMVRFMDIDPTAASTALETFRRAYFNQTHKDRWFDLVDETGAPVDGPVPASALYHLTSMALELERHLGS